MMKYKMKIKKTIIKETEESSWIGMDGKRRKREKGRRVREGRRKGKNGERRLGRDLGYKKWYVGLRLGRREDEERGSES